MENPETSTGLRVLLMAAAFVVVVAGLKAAAALLVPFLVAVFLSVISGPLLFWLRSKRVPSGLAVLLVVSIMVGLLTILGFFVAGSINRFLGALPAYEARLQLEIQELVAWIGRHGLSISGDAMLRLVDPAGAMGVFAAVLTSLGGLVTNATLVLLTVIFILLEASSFSAKIRGAFLRPEITLEGFREFAAKLNQYVAIKTLISLATGILVALWTSICGVEFAFLWGVVAFLLNYIPTIGSIFAAVPAVTLGLLQFGPGMAIVVGAGYLAINFGLGSVLEPRVLGRGLGISTLVVFVSLVFWAWVLGPIGMLLAVPLTMTFKIALQSSEKTRWIAILLGPEPPGPEEESEALEDSPAAVVAKE